MDVTAIEALVEEYLAWILEQDPTRASFHGAEGFDDLLPDLSAAGFAARFVAEDDFAARFGALDDAGLNAEQRIDRDLVVSNLRGAQIMRDFEGWRRNPDTYLTPALMGTFALFARRLRPEAELAASAVRRLEQIPVLVVDAQANLDPAIASPRMITRALGQCRAAVTWCRDLLPAEVTDEGARRSVAEAGDAAASSLETFATFLADLAEHARGDWAIGEARYSALLRERELLDADAASLQARGAAAHAELDAELRALCEREFASPDWRHVLELVNADRPATPEEMLVGYTEATARCRAFLVEHDLVSFPDGESCTVEPSPPFQRPVLAVASYFQPPALRQVLTGRFNVPFPPVGVTADELAERLADNSHPSMATTSAHEAYPGHHWHFARLQVAASPLRRLVTSTYFVEGWALYTERMMHEHGFFSTPAEVVCHLDARNFRAARIVVDTGLHCGEIDFDEAVEHMTTKTGLTPATARQEVTRYCAWPTQASSYLTGSLEIESIREEWFDSSLGSLREFHDRIAGTGALPLGLARRATLEA
ncbi:MAG: DUF885 domain-containing protein [Acidimicrobiales bacterium]